MRYLVFVETVVDAAVICDDLHGRVGPDDEVQAVTVHPPESSTSDRDRQEALNVVAVRLASATVETAQRRGAVEAEVGAAIEEYDPDEVVVGAERARLVSDLDAGTGTTTDSTTSSAPTLRVVSDETTEQEDS